MRKVGESPQGNESFHSDLTRASVCRRLSQWWLAFVLFRVDATLSDECGI